MKWIQVLRVRLPNHLKKLGGEEERSLQQWPVVHCVAMDYYWL